MWIAPPAASGELEVTAVDLEQTRCSAPLSATTSRSAEVMRTGNSEGIEDLSTATNVPEGVVGVNLGPRLDVPLNVVNRPRGTLEGTGRARGVLSNFGSSTSRSLRRCSRALPRPQSNSAKCAQKSNVSESSASVMASLAPSTINTVIQHLFAIGMSLQATRRMTEPITDRIDAAVADLDGVIHDITPGA